MMRRADRWLLIVLLLFGGGFAAAQEVAYDPVDDAELEARRALRVAIERLAAEEAPRAVAPPDRFVVASARFAGATPMSSDAMRRARWVLEEADGPNRSGTVRIRFRGYLDGEAVGEANASVRGSVHGPALVATDNLARGEAVAPHAVAVRDVDLTRLDEPPLRERQATIGFVPDRTIADGRILTRSQLRTIPLVRRNEPALLVVRRGTLTVTARGRALADGGVGETVAVENTATGARMQAEVQPDGTLRVVGGTLMEARRR